MIDERRLRAEVIAHHHHPCEAAENLAAENLAESIAGLLRSSNARPGWLTLEVTESTIMTPQTSTSPLPLELKGATSYQKV